MTETAGRGMGGAGRGMRDAGRGEPEQLGPRPFGHVMREEGMAPPAALARAIEAALGGDGLNRVAQSTPENLQGDAETFLRAAERVLERVLSSECQSRDSALDLLTVDALMTRAMAIAAQDADALATFPELAMKRIASK